MTCPHCGAHVTPGSRFCTRCRKRVAPGTSGAGRPQAAPRRAPAPPRSGGYARTSAVSRFTRPGVITLLGVLNILGGLVALGGAAAMIFVMLGTGREVEGQGLLAAIFALFALVGLVQLATGIGLLRLDPWARTLQIVLAGLMLVGIPCGTIIGILILVYMLKPEVKTLFSGVSPGQLPPEHVAQAERLSQGSGAMVAIVAVVVIIGGIIFAGIIAAIAIPSLLRARVSANESAAIGDLRTVVSAQAAYSTSNNGFPDQLECLAQPAQCIPAYPAGAPVFLDTSLLGAQRRGYQFRFVPGPQAPPEVVERGEVSPTSLGGWAYVAVPVQPGQTGVRSFCADMSGIVCFRPDGTPPDVSSGACPASDVSAPGGCIPIH
jgi:type IV pilus assembly protein PilA